jgi:hypothetical protein
VRATKKPGFQLLLPLLLLPSIEVDAINIDGGQVQYIIIVVIIIIIIIIIRSKKSLFFENPIVFYDNNNNNNILVGLAIL